MKGTINNVFEKPVILLMLILICLTPISPLNKACGPGDPPDCSTELAEMSAAEASLSAANAALAMAEAELNEARNAIPGLQSNVTSANIALMNASLDVEARQDSVSAAYAVLVGLGVGEGIAIRLGSLLGGAAAGGSIAAALRAYSAARRALAVAEVHWAICQMNLFTARAALEAGDQRVANAIAGYNTAIDNKNTAMENYRTACDAYNSCASGS